MSVDPRAARGFASAVDAYERGRPEYPDAAVDALGIGPRDTVLDLAAGSGKLTRPIAARAGHVIAVDPCEPMLAALRRRSPDVDVRVGTAHAIPVADASADIVTVGAAIHWFGDDAACAEIARVLRPGGTIAVVGYRAVWDDQPWYGAFERLMAPLGEPAGAFPAADWRAAMGREFGPLRTTRVAHVHRLDRDGFLELVASLSWVANLAPAGRGALLGDVRRLIGDGELALRYVTEVATASRARWR